MERIQSALQKAREARKDQSGDAQNSPTREGGAALTASRADRMADSDRAEIWQALPAFEPKERELASSRIVAFRSSHDSVPYDVMRTKVMHQMKKNNWTRLAIASPTASAGKTLTSVNLAFSLARQTNFHTAVIELDMRRPALAKTINLTGDCQFARALSGDDPVEKHLYRYGKNLAFGANQNAVRNPAELLQSNTAAKIVDDLEARYRPDIMIFDTPPVFSGDDTLIFLDQVDCVLLVAEAEKSTIEEIDKCEQELATRSNVMGVVLNKCRYLSKHEEYGKEYS